MPRKNIIVPPGRATGRSTRIIDEAVQKLFANGFVAIRDHHNTRRADEETFSRFLRRLSNEHELTREDLLIDKTNLSVRIR